MFDGRSGNAHRNELDNFGSEISLQLQTEMVFGICEIDMLL